MPKSLSGWIYLSGPQILSTISISLYESIETTNSNAPIPEYIKLEDKNILRGNFLVRGRYIPDSVGDKLQIYKITVTAESWHETTYNVVQCYQR